MCRREKFFLAKKKMQKTSNALGAIAGDMERLCCARIGVYVVAKILLG